MFPEEIFEEVFENTLKMCIEKGRGTSVKVRAIGIKVAQVSRYVYLNKPINVIFKNEVHYNRSIIKMRLKAYVLDIRYEFAFMSDMTEVTIRELINHGLVSKEELTELSVNN